MADHGLNAKGAGGSKLRVFVAIFVIIAVVVGGLLWLRHSQRAGGVASSATLSGTPDVVSLPGVGHASRQYVSDVLQSNQRAVDKAKKTGQSAMPTLTRSSAVFHGTYTNPNSENAACTPEALKRAREAGVTASELRCQGCSAAALLAAGYTPAELLKAGYSVKQLLAAGVTPAQLLAAGASVKQLLAAGVTPAQLMAAGVPAAALEAAGVRLKELKQLGYPPKVLAALKNKKLCSVAAVSADRKKGMSLKALKAEGCSVSALKAAGFSVAQLKAAGFSAAQLLKAGFSPKQLREAGFTAAQLRAAGLTASQLRAAGYTAAQLRSAGYTTGDLLRAGVPASALFAPATIASRPACNQTSVELAKAKGVTAAVLKKEHCSATELKAAGFTAKELKAAGFTAAHLAAAGFDKKDKEPKMAVSRYQGFDTMPSFTTSANPQLAAMQKRQEEMLANEQRKQAEQMLQQGMSNQAQTLISAWTPPPKQTLVAGMPLKSALSALAKGEGQSGQGNGKADMPPVAKAGSVTFGVLDTSINSDYKGTPILATIVQGPLKGGRLLGSYKLSVNRVMLSFTTLSMPDYNKTIAVNVLAIDPETARTVLASNVDNHYLLRYGTLFASSFMSGIASAITTGGSTTTTSATAGTTHTFPELGTKDKLLVALGEVGTAFSKQVGKWSDTPPTVTLNSGTGMGLLFMSDLVLPTQS